MSEYMDYDALASLIRESERMVALTGAGISTESGIPDFRSDEGLWRNTSVEEVASLPGFLEDPERFYRFWVPKFAAMTEAQPNAAHRLLAKLEAEHGLVCIATQNIDALHQRAGSKVVHEVHGTYVTGGCVRCEVRLSLTEPGFNGFCKCGGPIKPDVVLFGEALSPCFEDAREAFMQTDLVLVLGTSLAVYPIAGLVPLARSRGAHVVIVNRDRGPWDGHGDTLFHTTLGEFASTLSNVL